MAYQRKTYDQWDIEQDWGYGHGWEPVNTEETREDAIRSVKKYRENQPGVPVRMRKYRVPIEPKEQLSCTEPTSATIESSTTGTISKSCDLPRTSAASLN